MALKAAKVFEDGIEIVLDVRRSKDRARQAKHRSKKEGVSRDITLGNVTNVTGRDQDAPAHVGDNKPTSENNHTTPRFSASAFEKPTRETMDELHAQLAAALGPALASKAISPKLFDLSPILGLLRGGQGPPADLEADVLPTLKAAAARSSPGSIKTWAYFVPAIREARDRRLTGAPVVQMKPNERPDPSAKRQAREANYARAVAGSGVFVGG
jgi:hypothetical protein